MIHRRSLLLGLVSSLAGPSIVRASSLDGLDVLRRINLDPIVIAYRHGDSPRWSKSIFNDRNIWAWAYPSRLEIIQGGSLDGPGSEHISALRQKVDYLKRSEQILNYPGEYSLRREYSLREPFLSGPEIVF